MWKTKEGKAFLPESDAKGFPQNGVFEKVDSESECKIHKNVALLINVGP